MLKPSAAPPTFFQRALARLATVGWKNSHRATTCPTTSPSASAMFHASERSACGRVKPEPLKSINRMLVSSLHASGQGGGWMGRDVVVWCVEGAVLLAVHQRACL